MGSCPNIFITCAFEIELEALIQVVKPTDSLTIEETQYHLKSYQGIDIFLFISGIGPNKSHQVTEFTFNHFRVDILLFSGIAGSLQTSLSIGDTVVPSQWLQITTGKRALVDPTLLQLAKNLPYLIFPETGLTSDLFVTDSTALSKDGAYVVDMETYYVAQLAAFHQIPFMAFRSVSDIANGYKDKNTNYRKAALASARATWEFIKLYVSTLSN